MICVVSCDAPRNKRAMLALNSRKWRTFNTYFGDPEELPDNLLRWREAIGTPDEEALWNVLRDQFLHQHQITDSAIAIVPHICESLPATTAALRQYFVIDLGQVHMAWRKSPISSISASLGKAYEAAIISIRPLACECLTAPLDPITFRYLLSGCAAICDHTGLGRFIFSIDSLEEEYPDLSDYI